MKHQFFPKIHILLSLVIFQAHADSQSNSGVSYTCQKGIIETVDQIMSRSPGVKAAKQIVRKQLFINREHLPQHPASHEVEQRFEQKLIPILPPHSNDKPTPIQAPAPEQSVTRISLNFLGADYDESGFVPPDADGAVGPQQCFIVASGIVKTFNKASGALDGVVDTSLDNFFASVLPTGSFVGDIRVFYDTGSQRFFVLGRTSDTATECMVIAVSSSSVINDQTYFTFYSITTGAFTGGLELDYPSLGIDSNAILSGSNLFDAQGNFVNSLALVIQKSSLLNGGPIRYTVFNNLINFNNGTGQVSPQGVTNFSAASQSYIIGTSAFYFGALVLNIVNNPGSANPTLSAPIIIPVAPTTLPLLVPHKGNIYGANGLIGPTDDRLNWSHIRNGSLWTCHNAIGVNNAGHSSGSISRDGVRWYQLNFANPGNPTVTQYGTLYNATASNDDNELNYFIGSIMTSEQSNVLVGSTVAGTNHYLDATVTSHLATDAAGTLGQPVNYTSSSTAYNLSWDLPIYGFHRWGDYSTITLDPSDGMTFWSIQEYCNAANSWGLQVAKIMAPPPAAITAVSPSSVGRSSSVTVTISGQTVSGAGFYDPGAGFANRLQVAVSGVTVKSVTYVNPTTIQVVLDTANASLGAKTITVTNPDGQQVSKASALKIT